MPTARAGYYLKDGKTRVPSVTTVIGRFKEAGGLMHWAWQCGKDGKDYREERDNAASAGTIAHHMVEEFIHHGENFQWSRRGLAEQFQASLDVVEKAERSFTAFLEWAEQTKLRVTHTEQALVSEKYRFGGTFDAILIGNRRAMGDWKSSNAVYGEYLIQVAAYGKLWQEHFPEEPIDGGYHLLRFDKTHGDFTHKWWGELDRAWDAFLHLRDLYEIDKELKARAK